MAYRGRDPGPRGGAEHLARIHGTEEDKVNCPFYFKIGACRHGDRCSRQHHRPPFSQTVLVPHMWQNPYSTCAAVGGDPSQLDERQVQEEFDEFYEEIFEELHKFGKLEDLQVCENLGDHMVGNVYVKFSDEEDAAKAVEALHGRFYAGKPLICEYSPVTDFREARCRQFDEGTCARGGYCNFLHIKEPSRDLRKHLEKEFGFRSKGGDRGDRGGDRDRDRDRDRGGDRDRDRDRSRDRRRDRGDRDRRRSRSRSRDRRDRHGDRDRDRDYGRENSRDRDRRDRDKDRDGERSRDKDRERDRDRDRESRHQDYDRSDERRGDRDRGRDRDRDRDRERDRDYEGRDRGYEHDRQREQAPSDEAPRERNGGDYPPSH